MNSHGLSLASLASEAKPLAPSFGLEFTHQSLANLVSNHFHELYQALIRHKLLIFRKQDTSPKQLIQIAKAMGEVQRYPFSSGIEDYPEIVEIRKEPTQQNVFSGVWHIDSTYLDSPPDFTLLAAKQTPLVGGDTVFSDAQKAFFALSEGMQKFLLAEKAEYISNKFQDAGKKASHLVNFTDIAMANTYFSASHFAAKRHEETGIPAIYVNDEHTSRFSSMSTEESAPILNYLFRHLTRDEFTARVQWENDTIVIWDNRGLQHHAVNDYFGELRVMHRLIIRSGQR
ncbi:TauD/TfdA family dioxygenase [Photobacterium sp. CCB-ST2H9]|uniref:TauD/TfdA dioxygenase family protein n=1 Tax=Photobacterium sp. CCB-ST2H9 TaxID=2912855 RepID=UPI002004E20B|nr:TauD/TfdA family dioxygenase [Photobacterium sp. CCB-ST2H9]UTM60026.1 TauD/TfdA family dioxygenase [Photobacterium sp. CCB-ST2H9]